MMKGTTIQVAGSIFELDFFSATPSTGFSDPVDGQARMAVVTEVFEDLSQLLVSGGMPEFMRNPYPNLTDPENRRVRLRIDADRILGAPIPAGRLAQASQFYDGTTLADIAHGRVWEMINTGYDEVNDSRSPDFSANLTYHGVMAVNFAHDWHYDLGNLASGNKRDMYSTVLHEAFHLLGFASLMDASGAGLGTSLYSPYDLFLKSGTPGNLQPLIDSANCYQYSYMNSLGLQHSCNAATRIYFDGLQLANDLVEVHAPVPFNDGSSLSHLGCGTFAPYLMDANSVPGPPSNQREPTMADIAVLCDLGYDIQGVFGDGDGKGGYRPVTGLSCGAGRIAGNDDYGVYDSTGVVQDSLYIVYSNVQGANSLFILESDLIANDIGAVSICDVQRLAVPIGVNVQETPGVGINITIGNVANSSIAQLMYRPVNAQGRKGNVTYISILVVGDTSLNGNFNPNLQPASAFPAAPAYPTCGTSDTCNLVCFGDLEAVSPLYYRPSGDWRDSCYASTTNSNRLMHTVPFLWNIKVVEFSDQIGNGLGEFSPPGMLWSNGRVAQYQDRFGINAIPSDCPESAWCDGDTILNPGAPPARPFPEPHPDGGDTYMGLAEGMYHDDGDALVFRLKSPLRSGREYRLSFLGHSAYSCSPYDTVADVGFYLSRERPCSRDSGITELSNMAGGQCTLGRNYVPVQRLGQVVDVPEWRWYFQTFTATAVEDSLWYMVVSPKFVSGGDSTTMVLLDNISIVPMNTLSVRVSAAASELSPCTGDTVDITFQICLDTITGLTAGTNPYAFNVGLNLTGGVQLLPGSPFGPTGQFTVPAGAIGPDCNSYSLTAKVKLSATPGNVPATVTLAAPSGQCAAPGSSYAVTLRPRLRGVLSLTKTVDDSRWEQDGDTLFYTLRVENNSFFNGLTGLMLSDTLPNFILPGGQTFIFTDTALQVSGNVLSTATPFDLSLGGFRDFTFGLVPSPNVYVLGFPITNCAYVTAGDGICGLPLRACAMTKRCVLTSAASDTLCLGEQAVFSVTPAPGIITWSGPAILSSVNAWTLVAAPLQDATYSYTVTDQLGGQCNGQVQVTVLPSPTVSAGPDLSFCTGSPVTLQGAVSGAQDFGWSPRTGLYAWTDTMPFASPVATRTYVLTATGANGCQASDSMILSVSDAPLAAIVPHSDNACLSPVGEDPVPIPGSDTCDLTVCEGSTVRYGTASLSGGAYAWQVLGGEISGPANGTQIDVLWGETGVGMVYLSVTDASGCAGSSSQCVSIIPSPEASFTAPGLVNGAITVCLGQQVKFYNTTTGAMADINRPYLWEFGDNTSSDDADPTHAWTTAGTYDVTLTAINACNCSGTYIVTVTVEPESGPDIDCVGPVCAGGVGSYGTTAGCGDFVWTATGGTVISGQGTSRVSVAWGSGAPGQGQNGPGLLSLSVPGCGGFCSAPTTVEVPIIPATASIEGDDIVCVGELTAYSLPEFPGSEYIWSVTGGDSIIFGQGTNEIYVRFDGSSSSAISVTWDNAFLGCAGSASLSVLSRPGFTLSGPAEACTGSAQTYVPIEDSVPALQFFNWYLTLNGQTTSLGSGAAMAVTFPAPGKYTVKAVPANTNVYCNPFATWSVDVGPGPTAPTAISGEEYVCPGPRKYVYSAPAPSADTYIRWTVTGGSPATAVGGSISVSWATGPGPRTVTAQTVSTLGDNCISALTTVDIFDRVALLNATPPFTGPDTACANSETSVIFPPLADRYEWSLTDPSLGSIVSGQGTNGIAVQWNSVATAQQALVRLQTVTCGTASHVFYDTVHLRPSPQLEILADTSVCSGVPLSLSAGLSGTGFHWDFGDGSIETDSTVTHAYGDRDGADRQVLLTVDSADGCAGSLLAAVTVRVRPLPRVQLFRLDAVKICSPGADTALLAISAQATGYTYRWLRNDTLQPVQTPQTQYLADMAGLWSVQAENAYGCLDTSNAARVFDCSSTPPSPNCTQYPYDSTKTDRQWADFLISVGCLDTCSYQYYTLYYSSDSLSYAQVGDSLFARGCIGPCAYYRDYETDTALRQDMLYALGCLSPCDSLAYMLGHDLLTEVQYDALRTQPPYCCTLGSGFSAFSFNLQRGDCGVLSVQPMPVHPMGAQVLSVTWYGAGGTVAAVTPGAFGTHAYTDVGSYRVSALVEYGANGCTGQRYVDTLVSIGLSADFHAGFGCNAYNAVQTNLTDLSSYLGDAITDWQWDVDNGAFTSNVQHFYPVLTPGQHSVRLTVQTANGLCSVTKTVNVPDLPTADFTLPQASCEGIPLTFADASTPAGKVIWYRWDFGDMSYLDLKDGIRTYSASGNYPVILHVRDIYGCRDSVTRTKTVVANGLEVSAIAAGSTGFCKGEGVNIFPIITAPQSPPYSFLWSNGYVGDTLHAFGTGDYNVWITNSQGCRDQSDNINVGVSSGPGGSIRGGQVQCANVPFTLRAPDVPGISYHWELDGAWQVADASLTLQLSANSYLVTLLMTDSLSNCAADTLRYPLTVRPAPVAPASACSGPVTLTAGPLGAGLFLSWEDGSTGGTLTTSAPGLHSLTVRDSAGCMATMSEAVYPGPDLGNLLTGCFKYCDDNPPPIYGPFVNFDSWEWLLDGQSLLSGSGQPGGNDALQGLTGGLELVATTGNGCTDTAGVLYLETMPCQPCEVGLEVLEITCGPDGKYLVQGNLNWNGSGPSTFTLTGEDGARISGVSGGILYGGGNPVTFLLEAPGSGVCLLLTAINGEGETCTGRFCIDALPGCQGVPFCGGESSFEPGELQCIGTAPHGNPVWQLTGTLHSPFGGADLLRSWSPDGLVSHVPTGTNGGSVGVQLEFTDLPPYSARRCLYFELRDTDNGGTCILEACIDEWPDCGDVGESIGRSAATESAGKLLGEEDSGTGISLTLAPNPASTQVRVGWEVATTDVATEGPHALLLHDSRGRLVRREALTGSKGSLSLPLDGLAKGIYLVRLVSRDGTFITERLSVY